MRYTLNIVYVINDGYSTSNFIWIYEKIFKIWCHVLSIFIAFAIEKQRMYILWLYSYFYYNIMI